MPDPTPLASHLATLPEGEREAHRRTWEAAVEAAQAVADDAYRWTFMVGRRASKPSTVALTKRETALAISRGIAALRVPEPARDGGE